MQFRSPKLPQSSTAGVGSPLRGQRRFGLSIWAMRLRLVSAANVLEYRIAVCRWWGISKREAQTINCRQMALSEGSVGEFPSTTALRRQFFVFWVTLKGIKISTGIQRDRSFTALFCQKWRIESCHHAALSRLSGQGCISLQSSSWPMPGAF